MTLEQLIFADPAEKPLDTIVSDGGYCGIFRTIGCVGDSLSSGEFEGTGEDGKSTYHDMYDYSWGQYLARMAGCTARNFSRGGMTGKEYCESFAEARGFWDPAKACQAYIIALGVNDLYGLKQPVGEMSDVNTEDADTFTGWYARIIRRLKGIQPKAKFFFVTIPRETNMNEEMAALADAHAARLHELAAYFKNVYVMDFRAYAPVHDEAFTHMFYLHGHMNPMGYRLFAEQVCSYMDYIIRHNPREFVNVPFIGNETPMLC